MATPLSPLLPPAVIYILGFFSGYVVSAWVGGLTKDDVERRIALLITLIWILSVTAGIVVPDYSTGVWIHAIMGGVAGYLFSGKAGLSVFPSPPEPSPPDPPPQTPRRAGTGRPPDREDSPSTSAEDAQTRENDTDTDTDRPHS